MKIPFKNILFFTCVLLIQPLSAIQETSIKQKFSIKEASKNGLINYRLSGTDGSHYSDCMGLVLQSNTDSALVLDIKAGTELIPHNHKFQTMIVTRDDEFLLPGKAIKSYTMYAMCGEFYDEPPIATTIYNIGDISQKKDVAKLARYIDYSAKQNYKGQYAMWSVTDQISNKDLKKYGATNIDINDVLDMTKEAKIPVKLVYTKSKKEVKKKKVKALVKSVVEEVKTIKPPKPEQIIEENKDDTALRRYGYQVIAGILLVSGVLAFAIRRKKKKMSEV